MSVRVPSALCTAQGAASRVLHLGCISTLSRWYLGGISAAGINDIYAIPLGADSPTEARELFFEVQLHTPESIALKKHVHPLMKRMQNEGPFTDEAKQALTDEMTACVNACPIPPGALDLDKAVVRPLWFGGGGAAKPPSAPVAEPPPAEPPEVIAPVAADIPPAAEPAAVAEPECSAPPAATLADGVEEAAAPSVAQADEEATAAPAAKEEAVAAPAEPAPAAVPAAAEASAEDPEPAAEEPVASAPEPAAEEATAAPAAEEANAAPAAAATVETAVEE